MNKKILLVQPHKMLYFPLAFKKISAYHKARGDKVEMTVGRTWGRWDAVYITTLLSSHWKVYLNAIDFYQRFASEVNVGGPAATMLADDIYQATGIMPARGLVPEFESAGLDHSIAGPEYNYSTCYTTRGCTRSCRYCIVKHMEPKFIHKIDDIAGQIDLTRRDLYCMDNNVLASDRLDEIVNELVTLGFGVNAEPGRKKHTRKLDFNQGLDCRLFTPEKAKLLRNLNLRPLRFSLDSITVCDAFEKAIDLAVKLGFRDISVYALYGYFDPETGKGDRPEDLYHRLDLVKRLNEKYNIRAYVFPMAYLPLTQRERKYTSPLWGERRLRGFQLMKNVYRGLISTGSKGSFEAVVGQNTRDFLEKLLRTDEQVYGVKIKQPSLVEQVVMFG